MIYQSQAMHIVIEQAKRFAQTSATVLIAGESGTGKELLARLLHDESDRCKAPYVAVNCAALSESLVESELFGHEQGSFTGALSSRRGLFETAGEGTIFLDEVSEIPPRLQAKLLRVLEEHEFQRVGGNDVIRLRARIVAASNRPLAEEALAGNFRLDLFHRLNVLRLDVPPLRCRPDDIPSLVSHFIDSFRTESVVDVDGLSDEALRHLQTQHWPGNIRELRNVVHRACVLATRPVLQCNDFTTTDTDPPLPTVGEAALESLPLSEIERRVILARIEEFGGNKTAAAAALGVTARTLRNKMSLYRRLGEAG